MPGAGMRMDERGASRYRPAGLRTLLAGLLLCALPAGGTSGQAWTASLSSSPRSYTAHRAASPIVIDGRLDEEAWSASERTEPFVDIRGDAFPQPEWSTTVRMLWDEECLYVAAELEEPHLWATLAERDDILYRENDFEVFIDPDGDGCEYYEFEVNALGTMFDLFLDRPYREGGRARIDWDAERSRWAVGLEGTLNDPSDRDRGWRVELAIAWADLVPPGSDRTGRAPVPGEVWRINFSRVQWPLRVQDGSYRKDREVEDEDGHPEENWVWSPQGEIDMHIPSRWGAVTFAGRGEGGRDR